MFISLDENESINSDYIIKLHIAEGTGVNEGKHVVLARIISGNLMVLKVLNTREEAEEFYSSFINQSSVHSYKEVK